jgi:hypothetical protein
VRSPLTRLPKPEVLASLSSRHLLAKALLLPLVPIGLGILVLCAALNPHLLSEDVGFGLVALFVARGMISDGIHAWRDRRRANLLIGVPLPAAPGVWWPNDLPLSAHGRLILAQAAPIPPDWAIGHDGRHAYVLERDDDGDWRRLAQRPRPSA